MRPFIWTFAVYLVAFSSSGCSPEESTQGVSLSGNRGRDNANDNDDDVDLDGDDDSGVDVGGDGDGDGDGTVDSGINGDGDGDSDEDGGVEPIVEQQDCSRFDPDRIHLWGVSADRSALVTSFIGPILNEIDDARPCNVKSLAALPKVRPTDGKIFYRTEPMAATDRRLIVTFEVNEDGEPLKNDSQYVTTEIPTACGELGASLFHFHPETGALVYNCLRPNATRPPFLISIQDDVDATLQGPWFDEDGAEVWQGPVYAVGRTTLLVDDNLGFYSLGVVSTDGGTVLPVTYDGEPIDRFDYHLTAVRAHGDRYRVVIGSLEPHTLTRRLFLIDTNGTATLDAEYPLIDATQVGTIPTKIPSNVALDADGRLYEDLGQVIVVSDPGGTQHVLNDKRGVTEGVFAGRSAYFVTGP